MDAIAAEQFRALRTFAVWRRPHHAALALRGIDRRALRRLAAIGCRHGAARRRLRHGFPGLVARTRSLAEQQIGRASCRERRAVTEAAAAWTKRGGRER